MLASGSVFFFAFEVMLNFDSHYRIISTRLTDGGRDWFSNVMLIIYYWLATSLIIQVRLFVTSDLFLSRSCDG